MTKTKVIKQKGIITTEIINEKKVQEKKKVKKERIKPFVFDFLENDKDQAVNDYQKSIFYMITILKRKCHSDLICQMYDELINVDKKIELKRIFFTFLKKYYQTIISITEDDINEIIREYHKDEDPFLNAFSKIIIHQNFIIKLEKFSINDFETYSEKDLETIDIEKIMNKINVKFPEEKKESNLYKISKNEIINIAEKTYKKEHKHLCFGCPVPILNCPKILHKRLKPIQEYNFITDGEQIYTEDGELESFVVTRCLKLEKQRLLKK